MERFFRCLTIENIIERLACCPGRENLRTLSVSDLALRADPDGSSYIFMVRDEQTKNHQLDTNTADDRMYEIKGNTDFASKKC